MIQGGPNTTFEEFLAIRSHGLMRLLFKIMKTLIQRETEGMRTLHLTHTQSYLKSSFHLRKFRRLPVMNIHTAPCSIVLYRVFIA